MSKHETIRAADKPFRVPDTQLASCGDLACEFLINPIPRPTPPPIKAIYKPAKREVLLINTDKPNSMNVMKTVQRMLRERGIPVQEEILIKHNSSQPLEAAQIEAAVQQDGLLVSGVNDCGSCSWGGLLDTLILQRRGTAAVCVVTEPFRNQMSRMSAYQPTDRPLPFILVGHPLQMISPEEVEGRARQIVTGIERLLDDQMPADL